MYRYGTFNQKYKKNYIKCPSLVYQHLEPAQPPTCRLRPKKGVAPTARNDITLLAHLPLPAPSLLGQELVYKTINHQIPRAIWALKCWRWNSCSRLTCLLCLIG